MGNQTSNIKKFTEDDIFFSTLKANKDKLTSIRKILTRLFTPKDKQEAFLALNKLDKIRKLPYVVFTRNQEQVASEVEIVVSKLTKLPLVDSNEKRLSCIFMAKEASEILQSISDNNEIVKTSGSMDSFRETLLDISTMSINVFNWINIQCLELILE